MFFLKNSLLTMANSVKRISCDGKTFWNMPLIGIGTFRMKGIKCQKAVEHALKIGYRHIDTAECYKNGSDIAKAIKSIKGINGKNDVESKQNDDNDIIIDRKDIFITSKLSPRSMKSENKVESAINDCLNELETDYIDLFLIHWPGVSGKKIDDPKLSQYRLMAWKVMEKYVNKGILRCIGVSNFEIKHLKPLINEYENGNIQYKPAINQFEFHPYYQRYDLIEYCDNNDIQITAYGSLGAAESHAPNNLKDDKHLLLDHQLILDLAKKYNKTAAQILLRYGIQHNCIVLPKSTNLKHIEENLNVFDFEIEQNDMNMIDNIANKEQQKFAWDPSKIH